MSAFLHQLPTLVAPPPVAAPLSINGQLRAERGPSRSNLAPSVTYLLANFAYWENRFACPVLAANMFLPPLSWKTAAERIQNPTDQTVLAALEALSPPGNLNLTPLNSDTTNFAVLFSIYGLHYRSLQ